MFFLQSCAQINKAIVKSTGYFFIPTPGTIAVNDKGEPLPGKRDSVFLLFVEIKADNIQWESAWKDGRSFILTATKVKAKVTIGQTKARNQKVEVLPPSPNTLWQLTLSDDEKRSLAPQITTPDEILLKGRIKNENVFVRVRPLIELTSPLYQ
jgi:hypothetical protein